MSRRRRQGASNYVMYVEVAVTVFVLEFVIPQYLKDEHIILSIARKIIESSNQFITKAELRVRAPN